MPCSARTTPASRHAALIGVVLAVAQLVFLPGCGREPQTRGHGKTAMARKTVKLFLEHLQAEEYEQAARYYAGPLGPLRDAFPAVPPGNVAALLEHFIRATGGFCPDFRIASARMRNPICYPVTVEFCTGGEASPIESEFLVYFDGRVYQLLGLPPGNPKLPSRNPLDPGGPGTPA